MVRTEVQMLLEGYESFNRSGRIPMEVFDEEIEFVQAEGLLGTGSYRGHDGLEKALSDLLEGFDYMRLEPAEVLHDDGRAVILAVRITARGKGSGAQVEATAFHVWAFRDGTAIRWLAYMEREDAFAALRQIA